MEPENTNSTPMQTRESSAGPAIGTIIVLLVIILGGVYFWMQRDERSTANQGLEEALDVSADLEALRQQDSSDETSSIEADLEATDVDSIGAELETI